MRLIPGKTKVQIELFRGVTLWDILVGAIALILIILVVISSLPHKIPFCIGIFFLTALLVIRLDEKPNYLMILHMFRHYSSVRRYSKVYDDEMLKKKAQNEVLGDYLDEYKEDVKRQEEEIEEDPDAEYYEEDLIPETITPIDTGGDYEEYEEYEEYENTESVDYDLDGEEDFDIHYVDDPDYTEDLDTVSDKNKASKEKKRKGLYTISFGKKKDENGEG
ncbi:MAG: hypothetical protein K5879_10535 [Lachnospiraceae bacterium]|nr:hypothetical protein [Lachnospiraceae bacterium]